MGGAAATAIGLQVAGTAASTYGAYTEGLAKSNYYKYLANNSRTEAGLVTQQGEQEAGFAVKNGQYQSKLLAGKTKEIEGTQAAGAGANVGGGSVTTADIAKDTFNKAHMDQMAISYNADMAAWRARREAELKSFSLNREAGGYDTAAKEAKRTGKINAFTSLLSGAGQIASSFAARGPTSES